ncbi:translation elongation factor Ts, partial [Escherichia sp. TWPC-MK]
PDCIAISSCTWYSFSTTSADTSSGKPKEIAEKMVEGRMKKFTGEVSLTGQPFVMEPSKTVGQLLKEHNAEVTGFIRFEVGEGIEKVETDFAAEVAAMSKQS